MKRRAPAGRAVHDDLTQQILDNREDMRNSRYFPIGKMLQLFLGPDDDASYMRDETVRNRLASITKVRGLQLDWGQQRSPHVFWNSKRNALVFPFGCPKPPRVADPRAGGITTKTISQDIYDYASGWIGGRDGSQFVVMQPVVYIGVWILDGLYRLVAHPDPITGKYPALLMKPDTSEAHIVYGVFELCPAGPGETREMPWEQRETASVNG